MCSHRWRKCLASTYSFYRSHDGYWPGSRLPTNVGRSASNCCRNGPQSFCFSQESFFTSIPRCPQHLARTRSATLMVGRFSFWQPLFTFALGNQVIRQCRGGPHYGSAGVGRSTVDCGPESDQWQVRPWRRSATGPGLGWQFEGLPHLTNYSFKHVELRPHSLGNRSTHGFS